MLNAIGHCLIQSPIIEEGGRRLCCLRTQRTARAKPDHLASTSAVGIFTKISKNS